MSPSLSLEPSHQPHRVIYLSPTIDPSIHNHRLLHPRATGSMSVEHAAWHAGQISPIDWMKRLSAKVARLQISRHRRQSHAKAVQLRPHLHLTAKPRGLGETKGKIKHVILLVVWFRHAIIHGLIFDDHVACRTCARSTTSTLEPVPVSALALINRDGHQLPSISRSCSCAMSSRLSPEATSYVCSSPSLSMNVT